MIVDSRSARLLWLMGAMGFLSGLPLSLSAFTLQLWFTTFGISIRSIGMTAWLGLPYTLKFLWSGLFDGEPPWILARLGRRRGWLMLVQPLLAAAAAAMALSDPGAHPAETALAALCLAFLSASQDILIDAWRIETFPEKLQGSALAVYVWGYRAAMLVSTTGVTWLASLFGWHKALLVMAALLGAGTVVTLLAPAGLALVRAGGMRAGGWLAALRASFLAPLRDFLTRPSALTVLAFVLLFRAGKVMADGSAAAFYRYGIGFSTLEIGNANAWGWGGTLAGAAAGAWLVLRLPTLRALMLAGVLQAASLGLYLALLWAGPVEAALIGKIMAENFAGALADMAFLTYLSGLCSTAFTATQYALLSSLAAVAFHTLGGFSGFVAQGLGYPVFYALTVVLSLPALWVLLQLSRRPVPALP